MKKACCLDVTHASIHTFTYAFCAIVCVHAAANMLLCVRASVRVCTMQEVALSEPVRHLCNFRCTGRFGDVWHVVRRRVAQDVSAAAKGTGRGAGGEEGEKRGGEGEGLAIYVWVDDVLSLEAPLHVHMHSARTTVA